MQAMQAGPLNVPQSLINARPHTSSFLDSYNHLSSLSASLHATANDPPLVAFGDVEMHDVSAPVRRLSTHISHHQQSHSRPQLVFSAAARPFVPPGLADFTTATMSAPVKRLPPHRILQAQTPSTTTPTTSSPAIVSELPTLPVVAQPTSGLTPMHHAGPHSRLGPHARKADVSAEPRTPSTIHTTQPMAHSTAQDQHQMNSGKDSIDQQTKSDPDSWVDVYDRQVKADVWTDVQEPEVKTEVKAEAVSIPEQSATLGLAPSAAELQAPAAPLNQMSTVTHHFGQNEWLPVLNDMKDPEKGRQLIRAIANYLRVSVESGEVTAAAPKTDNAEVLVEFSGGQCIPANVTPNTTVRELIKECASLTHANESEIRVVLKVGDKGHAYQSSEEL
ncbi:hypothetical protein QM012_008145 [Aureobasidium pullulans]|uniref:TUG ubiquitin-like domain-containing protein n=1 Tax=Aureobasidium pullulans TaxID=5580 RepID=A0ABR0TMN4_AURPU